jgi:hypothetical protein
MRTTISVATTACVVAALGCGDPSGPGSGPDKRPITIAFCPDVGPDWFAHQDEGGKWTRVTIVNDVASFEGTEKQAVAMAYAGPASSVSVIYTTATTIEKLGCEDNDSRFGPNIVKGTVANLGDSFAFINIGGGFGFAGYDTTSAFSVYGVNTGAQNLFATRRAAVFDAVPDKMIIRRGQTYANNDSIVLDFDAADAFALESRALTATGAGTSSLYVTHEFQSGSANIDLQYGGGLSTVITLPPGKLASGDFYRTSANVADINGLRSVIRTHADTGVITLPFGPAITTPTFTAVSTSPYLLRAELTAPVEYAFGASIYFEQSGPSSSRTLDVSVLKDYHGSLPAKWVLEIPDLRAADGFQTAWNLTGSSYDWTAQLIDGTIEMLSDAGDIPANSMVRFAMAGTGFALFGSPAPGVNQRSRAAPMRPRLLAGRK